MTRFVILKFIRTPPAYALKRHPIEFSLLILCILTLAGLEVWSAFSPLPARAWNAANLKSIQIADTGDFSFAVFGDNRNSATVFGNLLKLIDHDPEIAFAVSLGDMVQAGEKERYRYFFNQVKRYLGLPLLTTFGKYENRGKGRWLYRDIFGEPNYSFQIGRNYFIVLDNVSGNELSPRTKQWLSEELDDSRGYDTRIVFMYVPLYDPRTKGHHRSTKEASENLAGLFLKHRVTHIFASHIHGYFKGQWKGTAYTITGGAGAELDGDDLAHYFFHYLKVHIKNGHVDVSAKLVPASSYKRLGHFNYMALLSVDTYFRIHWIEIALFFIAGGLFIFICLSQLLQSKKLDRYH